MTLLYTKHRKHNGNDEYAGPYPHESQFLFQFLDLNGDGEKTIITSLLTKLRGGTGEELHFLFFT